MTTSRAAGVAQSGRYAARLQREAGPQKTVRLQQGETLKAEVFAHFEQTKKRRTSWLPLPVFEQEPPVLDGRNRRKLALRSGFVLPLQYRRKQRQMPEAFLEVVVRDSSGSITFQERKALSPLAGRQWQQLSIDYKARGEETAQVSLVNQSSTAAYFDNLTISQEPPVIVQENHYDPWGLNLTGIEKQGNPDHKFQYLNREKQEELGLGWLDLKARMYDPQLGRFHAVDPKSDVASQESLSPYQYGYNNPVLRSDPNGDCPICPFVAAFAKGVVQEYGTQVALNLAQGKSLGSSLTDVDGVEILKSGATDAATLGVGTVLKVARIVGNVVKAADNAKDAVKTVDKASNVKSIAKVKDDIHRIGGGKVENLKLKDAEKKLDPPGISVLKTDTPQEAAQQMRAAFPKATGLHEASKTVGSSNVERIREAGFDVMPDPTNKFPNHNRIIHPDGVKGFENQDNLKKLSGAFNDTTGN